MKQRFAVYLVIFSALLAFQCKNNNKHVVAQAINLQLGISLDSARTLVNNADWKLEGDRMEDSEYSVVNGKVILAPIELLTYRPLFFPKLFEEFEAHLIFRNGSLFYIGLTSTDRKYINDESDYFSFKQLLCSAYGPSSDTGIRILRGKVNADTIYYASWGSRHHGNKVYTAQYETLIGSLGFVGSYWQ